MAVDYHIIPPPAHLSSYVRFFWTLEGDSAYIHRRMADVSPELIFHYKGQFNLLTPDEGDKSYFLSGIHGPSHTVSRFSTNKSFGIFGAYLYPHVIPELFEIPTTEFKSEMVDMETLLGPDGRQLKDKMLSAPDNQARLTILSDYLSAKLQVRSNKPAVFEAIEHIIQQRGLIRVNEVASKCGLSERQFGRNFKKASGFTPKFFARIVRFQTAMESFGLETQTMAEIALKCGYYDQSHFIHEFKEFSGYLPGEFFAGNTEGTEWLK